MDPEDHPRKAIRTTTLRQLNQPEPVRVLVKDGVPSWVERRRVVQVRDCWRIDDEWWRREPVSRFYWELILEPGSCVTIYQDLTDGQWYRQQYGAAVDGGEARAAWSGQGMVPLKQARRRPGRR
jgi:hypothetical protein